ncbi:hypothetical protein TrRE_jg12019 [Triparma retinervis]|uniref:U1-type domain-containing protein n=1 Tax=Triparma retinervis TaxID=2557542 RepID=A0A9W7A1M4_9STRA|nr:hypothetical protein TrRE_jg12019 [Triparma retinervis]
MSSDTSYKKNVNVERRTWDKESFAKRAQERKERGGEEKDESYIQQERVKKLQDAGTIEQHLKVASADSAKPEGSNRAYLKARTSRVSGIDSKVGTSEIVADAPAPSITDGVTKSANGVGWHCRVCDCYLKDSLGYLDHINGKKHQRALGFTMRVEQSTVGGVMSKLEEMRRRKMMGGGKRKKEGGGEREKRELEEAAESMRSEEDKLEEILEEKKREKERKKQEKWKRKQEEKKRKEEEEAKAKEEEEEGGEEQDMMAMMGFKGFS